MGELDISQQEAWARKNVEAASRRPAGGGALKSGGGGGTYDGMEARVKVLEDNVSEIKSDMKTLIKEVAEMKGRVMAMPTTWQLVGLIFAIMAASFAVIRFGLHP